MTHSFNYLIQFNKALAGAQNQIIVGCGWWTVRCGKVKLCIYF